MQLECSCSVHKLVCAVLLVCGVTCCVSLPYHSTQGVLHTRPSLNDFLTNYLQSAQQHAQPQYGYPEYQPPSYQPGYISHRPRRVQHQQQNLEPLIQYLTTPDLQQDYANYDFSNTAGGDPMYTDSDGAWYDDDLSGAVIGSPSYVPSSAAVAPADFLSNEPSQQDVALAQLMLDHIAGKYSLEDLETLEREARLEENTENQLRALTKKVHRKKSIAMPYLGAGISRSSVQPSPRARPLSRTIPSMASGARGSPDGLITMSQRRGQKEEPVLVPATSVRRPIFVQQIEEQQQQDNNNDNNQLEQDDPAAVLQHLAANQKKSTSSSSSPAPSVPSSSSSGSRSASPASNSDVPSSKQPTASVAESVTSRPRTNGVVEVVKVGHGQDTSIRQQQNNSANSNSAPSTMAPYVQSAYEALKKYLDTERQARMNADQELFKSPQKRFVQEADPLRRQLNNLKKTVV